MNRSHPTLVIESKEKNQVHLVRKQITLIGGSENSDIEVGSNRLHFTLVHSQSGVELTPGDSKVAVNGVAVKNSIKLKNCDRISSDDFHAVFFRELEFTSHPGSTEPEIRSDSLKVLNTLASSLQSTQGLQIEEALHNVVESVVRLANAEYGYLVCETDQSEAWDLVASFSENKEKLSRKTVFSDSLLKEALEKHEPVFIESIIGHHLASAESVIATRIFSAYCAPLSIEGKIFGALCLFTRSAGRSIRKSALEELQLVASLSAMLMAVRAELKRAKDENRTLKLISKKGGQRMVGSSEKMVQALDKVSKLAPTDLSVIIYGETGTGKELVAKMLHDESDRSSKPFVSLNCAAIPSTLLESTLFGHEKGAFTGAIKSHPGKFVQADSGTLFLDEIGDLPLDLQAKLLRVLQEKVVEPVGSTTPIHVDIRIVAATHQDLVKKVQKGEFREDLYYRLNGALISLPPIRERDNDVILLARHFLEIFTDGRLSFSKNAEDVLKTHSWPGNVRELEQTIKRTALLCSTPLIDGSDLELTPSLGSPSGVQREDVDFDVTGGLEEAKAAFTKKYVHSILQKFGNNRSKAASELGISERTLYRILSQP